MSAARGRLRRDHAFTVTPEALTFDHAVTDKAHRMWCALDRIARGADVVMPARKDIAERLGWSTDTVDDALANLRDTGWLGVEINPGKPNSYTLLSYTLLSALPGQADSTGLGMGSEAYTPNGGVGSGAQTPWAPEPTPVQVAQIASSREEERTTTETFGLRAETAQTIIGDWIDWLVGQQIDRPPGRVVGQVAKVVGELLGEGQQVDHIKTALAEMSREGKHPAVLPSLTHAASTARLRANGHRPSTTDQRVAAGLALVEKYQRMEGA